MRSTRYKNEFDFVDVATEFELDLKEREFCCQVKFLGSRQPVTYNVLELCLVRFWNTSLPKCLNKDTMFVDICKEK